MWTSTIFDSLRESGNLPDEIASLMQEVKYLKVNSLSFKILIGISPAVDLFEGNRSNCLILPNCSNCSSYLTLNKLG